MHKEIVHFKSWFSQQLNIVSFHKVIQFFVLCIGRLATLQGNDTLVNLCGNRRWKRRAAIMAEEKRRRKIRAEAALGSLSVGSPLVGPKSDKEGVSYF